MSFVKTETNGQIFTIRLNRPERLNALSTVIREKEWLKLLPSFIMIII